MTRQRAPLFGRTRMTGTGYCCWIKVPGTPFTVLVHGPTWTIRKSGTRHTVGTGNATGPQAAANAARRAIEQWAEKVRAM